ncbi:hypothetical protein GN244_ATG08114 [Phytophthora infestans]|uniref:Uncharacterized protein n=1 Tax=Phytophthora infestans TaxID=4787 RepID=A0A833WW42_PHYIN|nr:hypothetical protein GN244_ATG08114 [Phytophthora infestans]
MGTLELVMTDFTRISHLVRNRYLGFGTDVILPSSSQQAPDSITTSARLLTSPFDTSTAHRAVFL